MSTTLPIVFYATVNTIKTIENKWKKHWPRPKKTIYTNTPKK